MTLFVVGELISDSEKSSFAMRFEISTSCGRYIMLFTDMQTGDQPIE